MSKRIEYENKIALQNNESIPERNKVTDKDMNEIKNVINSHSTDIETLNNKYNAQIAELANQNPQLPEIVDARQGMSTLGSIIKQKVFHFNNVADMKNCLTLVAGDVVQTLGYYEENDGGAGLYQIVNDNTLVDDGGSVYNLSNGLKAKLIIEDCINVRQFGAKGDETTDDTGAFQRAFTKANNLKIYIPTGKYKISDGIQLPDYVDVNCSNEAEIFYDKEKMLPENTSSAGLPMFVRKATDFDENNYIINQKGIFKWNGGIINGYASEHLDSSKENYWDEADRDGTTAWSHDYQRAFILCGFEKATIENVLIKDIFGHGISHFGNKEFNFIKSKVEQGIDNLTHPRGGSRRDGCSGCSEIINLQDLEIFADDDATAIPVGLNWAELGKSHCNEINVNNVIYKSKDGHYPTRGIPIYGSAENETIKNISINNVKGTVIYGFIYMAGNIKIENIDISDENISIYDQRPALTLTGTVDNLTFNGSKYSKLDGYDTSPLIRVDGGQVNSISFRNYLKMQGNNLTNLTYFNIIETLNKATVSNITGNIVLDINDLYTPLVYKPCELDEGTKKTIYVDLEIKNLNNTNKRQFQIASDSTPTKDIFNTYYELHLSSVSIIPIIEITLEERYYV